MTAARRKHVATLPLEPVPYGSPQYATEGSLRDAQAQEWLDQFVTFDLAGKRRAGRVVGCKPLPRMEPDEIPDFAVEACGLEDVDKRVHVRLVEHRCQFYEDLESAEKCRDRKAWL